jgi:hypothetical protein
MSGVCPCGGREDRQERVLLVRCVGEILAGPTVRAVACRAWRVLVGATVLRVWLMARQPAVAWPGIVRYVQPVWDLGEQPAGWKELWAVPELRRLTLAAGAVEEAPEAWVAQEAQRRPAYRQVVGLRRDEGA